MGQHRRLQRQINQCFYITILCTNPGLLPSSFLVKKCLNDPVGGLINLSMDMSGEGSALQMPITTNPER
jgi:hypothetical protein